ncbi:Translocation protein S66 [Rhodotorula kratochvilovae]
MDDVKLIWSIRDAKTSLTTLLGKGQIGDDLWERFLLAEKELEAEIVEVVGEANTFEPGYGQKIFNIASDMVSHERWKEVYRDINKRREAEKAKLASSTPPAAVLAPTPYLTPSSLTLSPSNPLPAAGTTPAPGAGAALLAPLGTAGANDVTSQPPSRGGTPAVQGGVAPVKPAPALVTAQKEDEKKALAAEEAALDPEDEPLPPLTTEVPVSATPASPPKSPQQAPTPSTQQTPKKGPQGKKGKKKPNVKGGR